jgi:CubicO group peptidase (beta-lactamase class C family)
VTTRVRLMVVLFAAVLTIVLSAAAGAAEQKTAESTSATTTVAGKLDAILRAVTARREFNGSVLIARRGRILLRKGYGWSDHAARVRNRPTTRFRISSLTNTFTAVSIVQLVARDKLRLETSICAYLPRCPRAWQALSVSELLEGRSGIPSIRPLPPRTRALDAWINWLRARPLLFTPGTARDRSEARQLLAVHLLEQASGQSWIEYLERNIFDPIGMRSTGLDRPRARQRATPYFRTRDRTLGSPASFPPLSNPDVVYGLMSTVDDMYRFHEALHAGSVVPLEVLERARPADLRDWPSHLELGHGPHGTADGWYTAYTHREPDGVTVLAFSNMGGYLLGDLESELLLAAIEWPPPRIRLSPAISARYVGRYTRWDSYYNRLATITVAPAADGLLRIRWDRFPPRRHGFRTRPHQALVAAMSETSFFEVKWLHGSYPNRGTTYSFEVNPDGRAEAIVITDKSSSREARYRRAEPAP